MIAFICHPYHRGGVTRWMVDFADECANNGEQVIFVTVKPIRPFKSAGNSETIATMLTGLANSQISVVSENVGWEFEFGSVLYKTYVYAKLLKQYVPYGTPIITSDDYACWNTSKYLADKYNYIGVLHSDDKLYYDLAKEFHSYIGAFVCVSERIKLKVLEECKACEQKVLYVIPCGIKLPAFTVFSFNDDILKIVFVGRITDPQKRPLDLVPIVESLSRQGISFSLNIIGEGPEKPMLEERLKTTAMNDHVHFLGWQDQETIYSELSGSNILLLTSAYEGMPIVVMEALACGCSIVSTKVSGVEDYGESVLNEGIIWLNDVGDTQKAVENIIMAKEKGFNRKKARYFAEQEFSMALCYSRYKKIIHEKDNLISNSNEISYIYIILSYLRAMVRNILVRLNMI